VKSPDTLCSRALSLGHMLQSCQQIRITLRAPNPGCATEATRSLQASPTSDKPHLLGPVVPERSLQYREPLVRQRPMRSLRATRCREWVFSRYGVPSNQCPVPGLSARTNARHLFKASVVSREALQSRRTAFGFLPNFLEIYTSAFGTTDTFTRHRDNLGVSRPPVR